LAVVEAWLGETAPAGQAPPRAAAPVAARRAVAPEAAPQPARPTAPPARRVAEPAPVALESVPEDDAPHPADTQWAAPEDEDDPAPVASPVRLASPARPEREPISAERKPERAAPEPEQAGPEVPASGPATVTLDHVVERWAAIVDQVRKNSRTLASRLEIAKPIAVEDGNVVVIGCEFQTHAARINEPASAFSVGRAVSRVLGERATVRADVLAKRLDRAGPQGLAVPPVDPVVTKFAGVLNARVITPAELAEIEALPVTAEFEAGDL
ncbi:MAG TPA: hypothetical protein VFN74_09460, partial [Chloroflexota bacterium]|nr:hypothetical protein [Chloroflexota bacterium]